MELRQYRSNSFPLTLFLSPWNAYLAGKCHRSVLSADQSLLHSLCCPSFFSMLKTMTLSNLGLILYRHSQYSLCPLKCSAAEMSWVLCILCHFYMWFSWVFTAHLPLTLFPSLWNGPWTQKDFGFRTFVFVELPSIEFSVLQFLFHYIFSPPFRKCEPHLQTRFRGSFV